MSDRYIDLADLVALLRRQIVVIAAVVLVVLLAAVLLVLTLKPIYTATALVLVDPSHKDLLSPDGQGSGLASDGSRVDSEVELVKSQATLLSVVDSADLVHDAEFGPQPGIKDAVLQAVHWGQPGPAGGDDGWNEAADRLSDATSVQRRGTTFLIEINLRSANAEFAARLANAIADSYIRDQRDAKIASVLASRDIVRSRIADASTALVRSEEAIDAFIAANLETISAETGRTDLAGIRRQLEALGSSQQALQGRADAASEHLGRADWRAVASSLQSQTIGALEDQRLQILGDLNGLSGDTQKAQELRAELTRIGASLSAAATSALTTLRQQISDDRSKVSELKSQLRSSVIGSDLPAAQLTALYEMQQNSQIARSQYQTLLARQKDLEGQAYLQVADSRVVAPAMAPSTPSSPNSRLILVLGGLAGLALGVAVAVGRESIGGGFHSAAQAEAALKLAVVSSIPRQKQRKGDVTPAGLVIDAPLSSYAESIRWLQVGVEQSLRRKRKRDGGTMGPGGVVMIASSAAGEGKTTIALSLARALVESGRSALLIDCDLRRPSLHRQLRIEPSSRLLDFLQRKTGALDIAELVGKDPGSGARIVAGGHGGDAPTGNLVAGEALRQLLAAGRSNFDVVILDTPPVGTTVDAIYLAEQADAIVYVLKAATTRQADARTALAALAESKPEAADILMVLNEDHHSRPRARASFALPGDEA